MRARILMLGLSLAFSIQPCFAASDKQASPESEAPKNIPISTVLQDLRMNGYAIVTKVELENSIFNIQTITPQGKEVSVTMKADTGEIIKPKQNPAAQVSFEDAIRRVEGSGYHDIYKAEYDDKKYIIRAFDQKDKKVKLKVDGTTGEIVKAWF